MEGKMVTISRDPFARMDIVRVREYVGGWSSATCAFCGQVKSTARGRKYLYRYGTFADGISTRPQFQKHLFCGIECGRAFNG